MKSAGIAALFQIYNENPFKLRQIFTALVYPVIGEELEASQGFRSHWILD